MGSLPDSFVPHCGQLPAPAPQQVPKECLQFHKARPLEQPVPVAHTGLLNLVRLADKRKAVCLLSFVRGYGSKIVRNAHTVVTYLGGVKDRDEIQNTLSSELYLSSVGVNKLQEPVPLSASTEAVKDLGVQSESQKPLSTGER
ncbi:hypothetical protein PAL_GLEAN10021903 [Pteropus alecto]|uniref:Uncharacterized protein n=1 Tax=Pteropus alecto TaxID=9402 RepID=L5KNZ1_PTEAL|nr:hypothetical protein PAL_GLEAN10021903 [Pteropus alecto]